MHANNAVVQQSVITVVITSVREVLGSIPSPSNRSQCHQRLATAATFLWSCVAQALSCGDGPTTRYSLECDTSSMINECDFFSTAPNEHLQHDKH